MDLNNVKNRIWLDKPVFVSNVDKSSISAAFSIARQYGGKVVDEDGLVFDFGDAEFCKSWDLTMAYSGS